MKRVGRLVAAAMMTLALAGCAVYGGPYGAGYYDDGDYYPYGYYSYDYSYPYGHYSWGNGERHDRDHGEHHDWYRGGHHERGYRDHRG